MLSAMIVDDEKRTIDGILESINWSQYDIEDVKWAQNGKQALSKIEDKHVDLVITDINMPRMNGIELAQHLWEKSPNTKVVFVTGYSDIDYIRSAFKYEAVDYIMKPINVKELRAAIERSVDGIKQDSLKKSYLNEIEQRLTANLSLMQDRFFKRLIFNSTRNEARIMHDVEHLQLQLPFNASYVVLVLLVNNFKYQDDWNNPMLFSTALINITEELISKDSKGYCFENSEDEFVCILPLSSEEINTKNTQALSHRLQGICNEISTHLENVLGVSLSIGVGNEASDLTQLSSSFNKAKQTLSRRFFFPQNQILFDQNTDISVDHSYVSVDFNRYQRIYDLTMQEDTLQVLNIIEDLFNNINDNNKNIHKNQVIVACHQIASAINSALLDSANAKAEKEDDMLQIFDTIQNCLTISKIKEELLAYARLHVGRNIEKNPSEQDEIIATVKGYIEKNYTDPISLQVLANEVFICQSYLCLLFKQKTGTTLTNYISQLRVDRAKKMLQNTDKKLIDICYEVGFNDSKYFSRIFKKYTGLTPSEYRSQVKQP